MNDARAPSAWTATLAVARHETRLLLYSPLTAIFQAGFLAALMAAVFLIADFYSTDEASILPMLVYLPWVALIFVPALAMRAFGDDQGDRGIELMLTLPLPVGAVVTGKFLAGYTLLLITLLFTAPFVATVYYLGSPDTGVIVAGYLAAALLLAAYFALALLAAALAREPVGAFVAGISILFVLGLAGWDAFARFLLARMPAALVDALSALSPVRWFNAMSQGRIDSPPLPGSRAPSRWYWPPPDASSPHGAGAGSVLGARFAARLSALRRQCCCRPARRASRTAST